MVRDLPNNVCTVRNRVGEFYKAHAPCLFPVYKLGRKVSDIESEEEYRSGDVLEKSKTLISEFVWICLSISCELICHISL